MIETLLIFSIIYQIDNNEHAEPNTYNHGIKWMSGNNS